MPVELGRQDFFLLKARGQRPLALFQPLFDLLFFLFIASIIVRVGQSKIIVFYDFFGFPVEFQFLIINLGHLVMMALFMARRGRGRAFLVRVPCRGLKIVVVPGKPFALMRVLGILTVLEPAVRYRFSLMRMSRRLRVIVAVSRKAFMLMRMPRVGAIIALMARLNLFLVPIHTQTIKSLWVIFPAACCE